MYFSDFSDSQSAFPILARCLAVWTIIEYGWGLVWLGNYLVNFDRTGGTIIANNNIVIIIVNSIIINHQRQHH